jgi:hypothetical protein
VAFAPPGFFGCLFSCLCCGDLGVDIAGVGSPVADGDPDEAYRNAGALGYQGEKSIISKVRFVCTA